MIQDRQGSREIINTTSPGGQYQKPANPSDTVQRRREDGLKREEEHRNKIERGPHVNDPTPTRQGQGPKDKQRFIHCTSEFLKVIN